MSNGYTQDYRRSSVTYASVSITIPSDVLDYDVAAHSLLFSKVKVAREVVVRNTHPMFIKLNNIDNDRIEVFAREGIQTSGIPIENLFITTVEGCVVRIFMVGYN